ncbi:hypothetical protein ANAEL_04406 [Anaerolineales bacterium]|nr:hypothetical protein ANAEL_04406 [Anaerolineales bacterium]
MLVVFAICNDWFANLLTFKPSNFPTPTANIVTSICRFVSFDLTPSPSPTGRGESVAFEMSGWALTKPIPKNLLPYLTTLLLAQKAGGAVWDSGWLLSMHVAIG